ncbi:hypothetical protein CBM2631_B50029 [Cupriavidus taiwanensis]|nr:hypothetical protein CBM2618_B40077 [Cupriavidus taiwanensis]SOZ91265.1 hypothetical protein CBM2622_B40074 [Cupriavidus taiwanensis]SPA20917.1 hypothetical protein CBM2631_B50029 [Cupriavidus taiwanensis]
MQPVPSAVTRRESEEALERRRRRADQRLILVKVRRLASLLRWRTDPLRAPVQRANERG